MVVYDITIKCPVTGRPVRTGLQTASPEEFAAGLYVGMRLLRCPACAQEHLWNKEDAFLLVADDKSEARSLWRPNR